MYIDEEQKPQVFGTANYVKAVIVHVALFLLLWYLGSIDFTPSETVIPIDLLVVVNENPEGVEDEPPPEKPPEPPPPEPEPPKPEPPKPDPPKPPEPVVQEAVVQEPVKTNIVKVVEKKPDPPKPPEPPKVDPKKAREERIAKMRASTTKIKDPPRKPDPPKNNGRTDMRPKDWEALLMAGYKPSNVNSGLDASEDQRCQELIRRAFYDRWESPAWTDQLREMHLSVQFGSGGAVKGYKLVQSSGDAAADKTVLRAASQVPVVRGLSPTFLDHNKTVTVRFKVKPE